MNHKKHFNNVIRLRLCSRICIGTQLRSWYRTLGSCKIRHQRTVDFLHDNDIDGADTSLIERKTLAFLGLLDMPPANG